MYMMPRGNGSEAYIANYGFWRKAQKEGAIADKLVEGISHETLHVVLKKRLSKIACRRLDRLCRPVGGLITPSGLPDHCCLDEIERYYKSRVA